MIASRRRFLSLTARSLSLGLAFGLPLGAAARAGSCPANDSLSLSQKNRRRSLGFKEVAPDPKLACRGCAFFTLGKEEGCGQCAMLEYTVEAGATCASFTPREG